MTGRTRAGYLAVYRPNNRAWGQFSEGKASRFNNLENYWNHENENSPRLPWCVPFVPKIMLTLQPFQRRFLKAALAPGIRTAVLSLPRGNGKSTLVAWLGSRALTPGDPLFVLGSESHIVAASIGPARR